MAQVRPMAVVRIHDIHAALEFMHKEVIANNQGLRTTIQKIHNTKTNFVPFSIHIGDYVMMHPSNSQHRKLNTGWIGPMRIVGVKLDFLFVVEKLLKLKPFTVHAQHLMPYPIQHTEQPIQRQLLEHAKYLYSSLQLVDTLPDMGMKDGDYEIFVSWF